jgi:hypothetical protein
VRVYPIVSVTNNSTVLSDDEIQNQIMPALQHQVSYHFKPYWDSGANLRWAGKIPLPNTWELAFLNDSDQAGALGYHDFDPKALPVAKVFAATDKQYGLSPSVTASHEILEMLADPYINLAAQTSDTEFYGYEVGDPVEADADGYTINVAGRGQPAIDVLVSNFILPLWFISESAGRQYDYKGLLTKPLEVRQDGYVSIYTSGQGWGQYQNKNNKLISVPLENDNPRFRNRGKA